MSPVEHEPAARRVTDKILVTGARGFLGRAVARCLRRQLGTASVLACDLHPGDDPNYVACDLSEPASQRLGGLGITGLIHCAAVTPHAGRDFFRNNILATHHLLDAIDCNNLGFAVLISSVSVFDITAGAEEVDLREGQAPWTTSDYGRSKLIQEFLFRHALPRERLAILRPSSMYGAGMAGTTLLPVLWHRARKRQPLQIRAPRGYVQNFLHVDDAAEIASAALVRGIAGRFNLFSNDTFEIMDLARMINDLTDNPAALQDETLPTLYPRVRFDNRPLRRAFGHDFRTLRHHLQDLDLP